MNKTNRPGIIWDFDDTLVNTAIFFEKARETYATFMVELGFPMDGVLKVLDLFDIENVKKCGGFLKECFPSAMIQTYEYFCGLEKGVPDPGIARKVGKMGRWVFEQKAVPLPFAEDVLEEISSENCFEMILATKGDPGVQWRRIRESGLKRFFNKIFVLRNKNCDDYRFIAEKQGLDPHQSWVIGNSIKSDINPGIQAGYHCLFIPNPYTWSFEMEEPVGEFSIVRSLDLVPEVLLKEKGAVQI